MENYQIIENFLDESKCNNIIESLTTELTWEIKEFGLFDSYLKKTVYENDVPVLEYYNELVYLMNKINIIGLIDVEINVYPRNNNIISVKKEKKHNFNHGVAIYYLNNNDGYTLLDSGEKIESIKNRLLLFESDQDYYESTTTNSRNRYSITFNYM